MAGRNEIFTLLSYSTSSDIKRWVQDIQYGKASSFLRGWPMRSAVATESTLGQKAIESRPRIIRKHLCSLPLQDKGVLS